LSNFLTFSTSSSILFIFYNYCYHKKEFEIAVVLDNQEISRAKGKSKKDAQQKAAQIALDRLRG